MAAARNSQATRNLTSSNTLEQRASKTTRDTRKSNILLQPAPRATMHGTAWTPMERHAMPRIAM
eukprot:7635824-Lingulodinium_polyedra.AAC.1